MNWPWVSRVQLERERTEAGRQYALLNEALGKVETQADDWKQAAYEAQSLAAATAARSEQEIVRSEARYAELMVSYRMLRLQGAVATDVPRETKQAEKPDPVMLAINRASRGDPELRRIMLAQAEIDRKTMNEIELVSKIERGNRPSEEMQ